MFSEVMSVHRGSLSLSREGVSVHGGGLCPGDPHMVMSGQYASYWNAFFFQLDLNITHSNSL